MKKLHLTGFLEREGDGFVALCPELDVASQGDSLDEARANLKEAVELFLETAPTEELSILRGFRLAAVPNDEGPGK